MAGAIFERRGDVPQLEPTTQRAIVLRQREAGIFMIVGIVCVVVAVIFAIAALATITALVIPAALGIVAGVLAVVGIGIFVRGINLQNVTNQEIARLRAEGPVVLEETDDAVIVDVQPGFATAAQFEEMKRLLQAGGLTVLGAKREVIHNFTNPTALKTTDEQTLELWNILQLQVGYTGISLENVIRRELQLDAGFFRRDRQDVISQCEEEYKGVPGLEEVIARLRAENPVQ